MLKKKSFLFNRFYESYQNFTTKHVKIIKDFRTFF